MGVLRVLVTAPSLGAMAAVLLEIPLVLAASWFAAKGCVAWFSVPPGAGARLLMGMFAFALTMAAELALSVLMFGRTVAAHFADYGHAVGQVGLAGQMLFGLIPYAQWVLRARE